jgi:hypothetical protein
VSEQVFRLTLRMYLAVGITVQYRISLLMANGYAREILVEVAALLLG